MCVFVWSEEYSLKAYLAKFGFSENSMAIWNYKMLEN